jgi:hypothetical protein
MFHLNQFILWKAVQYEGEPKPRKVPVNYVTGDNCDAHDAANWTTFDHAAMMAPLMGATGVGFVLTAADRMTCIDLDKCLQPDSTWSKFALDMLALFPGAFVEVSYSRNGLHIWFQADAPLEHKTRSKDWPDLEIYSTGRFIALGTQGQGDPNVVHTAKLIEVLNDYLPGTTTEGTEWSEEPVAEWSGPADDDELIAKMLASKPSAASAFDGKASLKDLWNCNVDILANTYPSATGDAFNHSSADAALMAHLAFWTGKDCERMDRLFRRSKLMREKYDDRNGYAYTTITKSCGFTKSVYSNVPEASTAAADAAPSYEKPTGLRGIIREGVQYLSVNDQLTHFEGCIYLEPSDRIFLPNGKVLAQGQFDNTGYGGYEFAMTADGTKPSKSAFEAFARNRCARFPKAQNVFFRPEMAQGLTYEKNGDATFNAYVPYTPVRAEGDITLFTEHLRKLFPNDRDRQIITCYMAAMVQYPGVKFKFAPLIQGMQGNGKSFLFEVMEYCMGDRFTHYPNPAEVANKFNAWIQYTLFVGISEIYISDKRELSDALKPLITDPRLEIQGKGTNQVTGDNRANFMLTSNHKDAIWKTETDRRYCVFFTGQQEAGDLERDGMVGHYFPTLFKWKNNEGGNAIIANYLHTYQIAEEFNPATLCVTAPKTSSTSEAITLATGGVEQEIVEATNQGRKGFLGGWISSTALTRMLAELRIGHNMKPNKRREMLKAMGYVTHTQLPNGRVTKEVLEEGNRPTLYVKRGHLSLGLTDHNDVRVAYLIAQGYGTAGMKTPTAVSDSG